MWLLLALCVVLARGRSVRTVRGPFTAEELQLVKTVAEGGNADVQYEIGLAFGHEKNYEGAAILLRMAATRGHRSALFFLGDVFRDGLGVPQNLTEAERLYLKASELGHAKATEKLFLMGSPLVRKTVPDLVREAVPDETMRLLHDKADCGRVDAQTVGAQFNLGVCYEKIGDDVEAARYYRMAADQGHSSAQFNIGNMRAAAREAPTLMRVETGRSMRDMRWEACTDETW